MLKGRGWDARYKISISAFIGLPFLNAPMRVHSKPDRKKKGGGGGRQRRFHRFRFVVKKF